MKLLRPRLPKLRLLTLPLLTLPLLTLLLRLLTLLLLRLLSNRLTAIAWKSPLRRAFPFSGVPFWGDRRQAAPGAGRQ